MSDEAALSPIDADLKEKLRHKYDPDMENDLRAWFEEVFVELAEDAQDNEHPDAERIIAILQMIQDLNVGFQELLKTGEILCRIANKMKPGIVKHVDSQPFPFYQMENIQRYLSACKNFGMAQTDLFSTLDLYQAKDMSLVQSNLFKLYNLYANPELIKDVKVAEKPLAPRVSGKSLHKPVPLQKTPSMVAPGAQSESLKAEFTVMRKRAKDNIAQQLSDSYAPWIEKTLNAPLPPPGSVNLLVSLKSGAELCKLINIVQPGIAPFVEGSQITFFKATENLMSFLEAAKKLNFKRSELFEPNDLIQGVNPVKVIKTLEALRRLIDAKLETSGGADSAQKMVTVDELEKKKFVVSDKYFIAGEEDKLATHATQQLQLLNLKSIENAPVAIALAELELPHSIVDSISDPGRWSTGQPTLFDSKSFDGSSRSVVGAHTILLYLAEKHSQLLPRKLTDRLEITELLFWDAIMLGPHLDQVLVFDLTKEYDLRSASADLARLNANLTGRQYIIGEEYSIGDIALFPRILAASKHQLFKDQFAELPALSAWLARIQPRIPEKALWPMQTVLEKLKL